MDDQSVNSIKSILGDDLLDFLTETGSPPPEEIGGGGESRFVQVQPHSEKTTIPRLSQEQRIEVEQRDAAELTKVREALASEDASPEIQAQTARKWEQASILGRAALGTIASREQARYTFQYNPRQFDRQDIAALRKKPAGEALTAADIAEARRASYAIALEAAIQTNEIQVPPGVAVREDAQSLDEMDKVVRSGMDWARELAHNPNGDRDLILNEARKAIARRTKQPLDQVKRTDQQLMDWTGQQFGGAHTRLVRITTNIRGGHKR